MRPGDDGDEPSHQHHADDEELSVRGMFCAGRGGEGEADEGAAGEAVAGGKERWRYCATLEGWKGCERSNSTEEVED